MTTGSYRIDYLYEDLCLSSVLHHTTSDTFPGLEVCGQIPQPYTSKTDNPKPKPNGPIKSFKAPVRP